MSILNWHAWTLVLGPGNWIRNSEIVSDLIIIIWLTVLVNNKLNSYKMRQNEETSKVN